LNPIQTDRSSIIYCFLLTIHPPPNSTLFPYTTLFRSSHSMPKPATPANAENANRMPSIWWIKPLILSLSTSCLIFLSLTVCCSRSINSFTSLEKELCQTKCSSTQCGYCTDQRNNYFCIVFPFAFLCFFDST